ncbi:hypothetical protein [Azospirillum sp. sgz302134]
MATAAPTAAPTAVAFAVPARGRRRPRLATVDRVAGDQASLQALAEEVRAFLVPLWQEYHATQRTICRVTKAIYMVAEDAPPSTEMHIFAARFLADLLNEATDTTWRVEGGSPVWVEDGRGGVRADGIYRPCAWATNGSWIVNVTGDQYGLPAVTVCAAATPDYVGNCTAEDLRPFLSRADEWVARWMTLWLRRGASPSSPEGEGEKG